MATVDELCRSYLDLKWHFDPAAASAAGVVAEDHRLGRFDRDGVRTYVAALRSVTGAIEALDVDDLQDEIDRTALLGELRITIARWEHEKPHVRNPSLWLSHLFTAVGRVLHRSDATPGTKATALLARFKEVPAFLEAARATIDAPASIFVDTALGQLGGGGELIAQAAGAMAAESPALAEEMSVSAKAALEALAGFGHALRDDIEPSDDPHAFAVGEEQFARRLHYEHALASEAPVLWRYGTHLQDEIEVELTALAAQLGGGSWRDLVERLRPQMPAAGAAAVPADVPQGLSYVRRHITTPVMVEGQQLFRDEVRAESGDPATPEARLLRLADLRWRAACIVLDVGLHTRGMTPAEAVNYLTDHLPMDRRTAEAEIRRYCAAPTYPLAAAVGRRDLLALREAYRERAGSGFSEQRFQDEIRRYGGIPISLARWGMGLGGE